MTAVGTFTGRHAIAELEGIDPTLLDDENLLRTLLTEAVARAGATVLDVTSKRFVPRGITVLLLLSESHASIYAYPEIGAAFVDVFTCGERADPDHAVHLVAEALEPAAIRMNTILRGHGDHSRPRSEAELCQQIMPGADEPVRARKP
ncbi:adenosylmethionine decarboxylase [Nocardia sp. 2YAB30]|uniref:adenosylmethionine decarboxylase n=1 Tax=unclassified Nocardia TaxID=2637762 RepID=UPI003F98A595